MAPSTRAWLLCAASAALIACGEATSPADDDASTGSVDAQGMASADAARADAGADAGAMTRRDAAATGDAAPTGDRDATTPAPDTGTSSTRDAAVADALPDNAPAAGNPSGGCPVPTGADVEDTSAPTRVVGDGTPASCTADAFIGAVALGGVITFDCGPSPITIVLDRPAKIFNNTGPRIVIDGGGLVTLSGGGRTRILYMNTCDRAQVWTTPNCDNQDHPRLTVQNITFVDGDSRNETEYDGGGAIFVRGGRFKVVNSRFFRNRCADVGPDVGGAGIRAFDQYNDQPVFITNSTFGGGQGFGNTCANGGGISSIGVSWTITNSLFTHNEAIGRGGNPQMAGTPGGGSGGAIYNDGNLMTLSLCGTRIEANDVVQHGSAIFFVTNNHTGNIVIDRSTITGNTGGSWYPLYPQISCHDDTRIDVTNSVIQ